jgi:gluconokinase
MPETFPRSPYDAIDGLVYFPRMLDKIRLKAAGRLPKAYEEFLGSNFDGRCLTLLQVNYEALRERVLAGGSDEEILAWCHENGRKRTVEEVEIWSAFMIKRGWRDETSPRIAFRLAEAGLEHRDAEVATMFDFIDVDEGRTPPDFRRWEPPRCQA